MMKFIKSFFIINFSATLAFAGGVVGNGGDEVGLDFALSARTAIANLKVSSLNPLDVLRKLESASILVVEEALPVDAQFGEQQSIARNFPESSIIQINRSRWSQIRETRLKEAIALHEILSLMGLESTGSYPISSIYLSTGQGPLETPPQAMTEEQLVKLKKFWSLKCDLKAQDFLGSVVARYQEAIQVIIGDLAKRGITARVSAETARDPMANFSGFNNSRFKLGVLRKIFFEDQYGKRFHIKTRDFANDEFYRMDGMWLEFNPVETGAGKTCGLIPVTRYQLRKSDEKHLPLYEWTAEGAPSSTISSTFNLFDVRYVSPRPAPMKSSSAAPRRASGQVVGSSPNRNGIQGYTAEGWPLFGACRNRTFEDEMNRRPCYFIKGWWPQFSR